MSASVFCVGEILVDCFNGVRVPGGAPANVACNVAALDCEASLVSRVGVDADGQSLVEWLNAQKVTANFLQTDLLHPTGFVRVLPGPSYEIADSAAWDFLEITPANRSAAENADALVFGTLAQRQPVSRKTIRELVQTARSAGVPVLCDLNLREPFYDEETVLWCLRNCDLLKLNHEELAVVSAMLHARGDAGDLFMGLLREFSISRGVLTLGGDGAMLYESGELWHQPAEESQEVSDTVGAGDAFTSVISIALAKGVALRQAAPSAVALAAFVVSQPGATPEIPQAVTDRVNAMLCA